MHGIMDGWFTRLDGLLGFGVSGWVGRRWQVEGRQKRVISRGLYGYIGLLAG